MFVPMYLCITFISNYLHNYLPISFPLPSAQGAAVSFVSSNAPSAD